MAMKGIVTGSFIGPNGNGLKNVRMLYVYISEPLDVQQVQFVSQSGDDTCPLPGAEVTIVQISESFKIAIASDDGIEPSVLPGEKKIYSFFKSFISFLTGGIIEINGKNDYAVRFNQLEISVQSIITQINDFETAYNTATYTIAGTGTTGVTSNLATPIVEDLSNAKVLDVKIRALGEVKT